MLPFLYYDWDLGKDLINVHVEVDWSTTCVNVDFVVLLLIDRFEQIDLHNLITWSGLLGNVMDVNSGEWTGKMAGLGAGVGKDHSAGLFLV